MHSFVIKYYTYNYTALIKNQYHQSTKIKTTRKASIIERCKVEINIDLIIPRSLAEQNSFFHCIYDSAHYFLKGNIIFGRWSLKILKLKYFTASTKNEWTTLNKCMTIIVSWYIAKKTCIVKKTESGNERRCDNSRWLQFHDVDIFT